MNNLLIIVAYYFFILSSILGFGLFFSKIFKIKLISNNFGYVGLFGLYILLIYSYLSNFFIAHSKIHNILLLGIGVIIFFYIILKDYTKYRKEILITSIVFFIISSALFLHKNHDDFLYYHFPYTYYLTQQSFYVGVGQFNHGFRTASSLFYLNSLFYLPIAKFYLFHFTAIYILGFANIILLKNIHNYFSSLNIPKQEINITNYLSLLSIIFINIFFSRIAEHGTDRSAQILIFLLVIELIVFINLKQKNSNLKLFNLYLLAALIVSLKAFYVLYAIFIIPLFLLIKSRNQSYTKTFYLLIFNKFSIIFLLLFLLVIFTNLINTGCIIYPVSLTCFDIMNWGILSENTLEMSGHYELWSKGGQTPNSLVSNPSEYIQGFNWVKNWINIYFFNKVSDFILGLTLLIIIVSLFFKEQFFKKKIKKNNNYIYLIYFILIILLTEWFLNHPALRYGGYCIIALLFFIPFCLRLEKSKINYNKYSKSVIILIIVTVLVFNIRNFHRINKEVNTYNYKLIENTNYFINEDGFRIQKQMDNLISQYDNCKKMKNNCNLETQKIYKKYGKIIFKNR